MLVDVQPLLNREGHFQYKFGKRRRGGGMESLIYFFQLTAQFAIQQILGVLFFGQSPTNSPLIVLASVTFQFCPKNPMINSKLILSYNVCGKLGLQ